MKSSDVEPSIASVFQKQLRFVLPNNAELAEMGTELCETSAGSFHDRDHE